MYIIDAGIVSLVYVFRPGSLGRVKYCSCLVLKFTSVVQEYHVQILGEVNSRVVNTRPAWVYFFIHVSGRGTYVLNIFCVT